MKTLIGLLLVIAGVIFGAYVGIWIFFVGGVVNIIEAFKMSPNIPATDVAIGIIKIMFAGIAGSVSAYIAVIPGSLMINQ